MTPQVRPAGPHAAVITLPTRADRFTVPNPKAPRDLILITTITVDRSGPGGAHISLQGQSTLDGRFHDLTAAMTGDDVTRAICNEAPGGTRAALDEALTPAAPTDLTQYRARKAAAQ